MSNNNSALRLVQKYQGDRLWTARRNLYQPLSHQLVHMIGNPKTAGRERS